MSIWLVRAGGSGEYERKFLNEGKIYLTWEELKVDLGKVNNKPDLLEILKKTYPDAKGGKIRNHVGQIFPFAQIMKIGDWVVLPSKMKSSIHFGEIKGDYVFNPKAEDPFYHFRNVEWFAKDIPRLNFDQDILYTLGAFLTICKISRNDAEARLKTMRENNWKVKNNRHPADNEPIDGENGEMVDLEQYSRDQIAKHIIQKYKGHGMAIIIESILKAKGYVTFRAPEGPDKGVDILAAPEPLGFGKPRLCIQVKTGDTPIDRPTLDQLLGTMQNFNAEQGLLVSWAGFKTSVDKEIPSQFFRIRLWDQKTIIDELLNVYDKLDEDFKAELPLKRIWTLNLPQDEL